MVQLNSDKEPSQQITKEGVGNLSYGYDEEKFADKSYTTKYEKSTVLIEKIETSQM